MHQFWIFSTIHTTLRNRASRLIDSFFYFAKVSTIISNVRPSNKLFNGFITEVVPKKTKQNEHPVLQNWSWKVNIINSLSHHPLSPSHLLPDPHAHIHTKWSRELSICKLPVAKKITIKNQTILSYYISVIAAKRVYLLLGIQYNAALPLINFLASVGGRLCIRKSENAWTMLDVKVHFMRYWDNYLRL